MAYLQMQPKHQDQPVLLPTVTELVEKAQNMTGEEKQDMALKYFQQAQRYEAGKDLPPRVNHDLFAFRYYDASSRLGNLNAKNMVGVFHSKGRGGLRINEEKAFNEFKAAAEAGHARAKRNLATYFARGCADHCPDGSMAYLLLNEVRNCCLLTPDGIVILKLIIVFCSKLSEWPSARDYRIRDQPLPTTIRRAHLALHFSSIRRPRAHLLGLSGAMGAEGKRRLKAVILELEQGVVRARQAVRA
jgi:hypothetical protein